MLEILVAFHLVWNLLENLYIVLAAQGLTYKNVEQF